MSECAGRNNKKEVCGEPQMDCFSKYAWLLPITQKKQEKVLEALGSFLREHTPKVQVLQVTMGESLLMPG